MHLTAFLTDVGYHEAAWRVQDGEPITPPGIDTLERATRTAERGLLDAVFLPDNPVLEPFRAASFPQVGYDPLDLIAALSRRTERIGLVATASTTYSNPYALARRLATLDHLSGGRVGWNAVTTRYAKAALAYGEESHPEHDDRYARATEYVEVVRALWDSWDDDAIVGDRTGGRWADPTRIHPVVHHGAHYDVEGALPLPRTPQGQPVVAQAGSSTAGVDLAGRFAAMVFTAQPDVGSGRAFRRQVRDAARRHGRDPDHVVVLPGLAFVLGSTEAEAARAREELEQRVDPDFRWRNLAYNAGLDPSLIDPDQPLHPDVVALAARTSRTDDVVRRAREAGRTFRQVADEMTGLPGGLELTGTPEQLADVMERWVHEGACDGFMLQPTTLPDALERFVDHVVPILQDRGLHRRTYAGTTLRDHLGIPRPAVDAASRRG